MHSASEYCIPEIVCPPRITSPSERCDGADEKVAYLPSVARNDAEVGTCDRQDGTTVFFVGVES